MSKFKKVLKKKELEVALSKHPLREIDEEVKKDYLKGLVFIAVEDENFSEDEKSYITALMSNIGVDSALLSEFENFASDPDEDELLSFMDRLKAFDEDVKLNFLIEAVVLAFKDGEFDESEKEMFNDYIEMLELEDKKDDIMYMATALVDKNIDLALSIYTAKKEFFLKFDYMFDMLDVDIEKELKELYNWEWVEFRLEQGQVEDNNLVASKPVSVREFCVFLNSLVVSSEIVSIPNTDNFELKNDDKELIIDDINRLNIDFENGLFCYVADIQNNDFLGSNEVSITAFKDWVNDKTDNSTKGLIIIISSVYIKLDESAKGFLTSNYEQFIINFPPETRFADSRYSCFKDDEKFGLEVNQNYAFRLMKVMPTKQYKIAVN